MDDFAEDYRDLNADEQNARRVLTLAIALINARRPLSSSEIYHDLYADMTPNTFRRTFLRDRGRLVVAGLVMRQVKGEGDDARWEIDEDTSFARDNELTQEDALMLDLLLAPRAADPNFPFARDLRLALTKIDRSFVGSSLLRIPAGARLRNANLSRVEDALAARRPLHIRYRRADGSNLERNVAPLGLFSLNESTYMVAAPLEDGVVDTSAAGAGGAAGGVGGAAGAGDPAGRSSAAGGAHPADVVGGIGNAHTYNLARLAQVREIGGPRYDIPDDFDVRDYIKLPFQMGPSAYTATFVDDAQGTLRHEDVYDTRIAAAWALAEGLRPTEPACLVQAWKAQVERVADWLERVSVDGPGPLPRPLRRRAASHKPSVGRGRKGGADTVRELVSLLGSLCHTGDTIELDAISARLGITFDEAQRLMDIVCQASGESTAGLLISCNDDETEFTLQYPGVKGRPVRLTPQETIAVLHGLDEAGIPEDDPLRQRLAAALSSREVRIEEVRKSLGETAVYGPLQLCARSQAESRELVFMYQGPHDAEARRRRAVVTGMRRQAGHWLITCLDLDKEQERTFRLDRMADARLGDAMQAQTGAPRFEAPTSVPVVFTDRQYVSMLDWPGLSIIAQKDDNTYADLLYYGNQSTWLPRRIIACNTSLEVYDKGIIDATRAYVQRVLQGAAAV